ncbi:MAG: response regulator [Bdellovibrionales bacterium]
MTGDGQQKKEKIYYILLVEDDSSLRDITERKLPSHGFRVVTAVNGLHAMQRLKGAQEPFSLVITDLLMPGQSGLDLVSEIRALPEFKTLPIIAFTGNLDVEVLKAAKLKGAQEVLVKPVSFKALLERIQMLI